MFQFISNMLDFCIEELFVFLEGFQLCFAVMIAGLQASTIEGSDNFIFASDRGLEGEDFFFPIHELTSYTFSLCADLVPSPCSSYNIIIFMN